MKNKNDRIVDYKGLLKSIGRKWIILALSFIIFALLGSTYKYIKISRSYKSETNNELIDYYKTEINSINNEIVKRHKYLNDTFVKDMSAYYTKSATEVLFIKNKTVDDSVINTEYADRFGYAIVDSLINWEENGIDWTELKKEYNIDDDTIFNELVTSKNDNDLIIITTYFTDIDGAERLLNYIDEQLHDKFAEITRRLGTDDYELIRLDKNSTSKVFGDNLNWMPNRLTELNNLSNAKTQLENLLSRELSNYPSYNDTASIGITCAKIGAFSGVFGIIAIGFLLIVQLIISNIISSYNEFVENTDSIPLINLSGKKYTNDAINTIQFKLDNLNIANRDILLVSDVVDDDYDKTIRWLNNNIHNYSFTRCNKIEDSVSFRTMIDQNESVMFLVKVGVSSYDEYRILLDTLGHRTLIGTMVI